MHIKRSYEIHDDEFMNVFCTFNWGSVSTGDSMQHIRKKFRSTDTFASRTH